MQTMKLLYEMFQKEFAGRATICHTEPVGYDQGYNCYLTAFIPTVLPEQLEAEFLHPCVLSLVSMIKEEKQGAITMRPLKGASYNYEYVNLTIDDKGVWVIRLMVRN